MSQPHTSKDLSFVRHPTKPSTYVPGHSTLNYVGASLAISLGVAILAYMALVIATLLPNWHL
jgi:hypothetical protein